MDNNVFYAFDIQKKNKNSTKNEWNLVLCLGWFVRGVGQQSETLERKPHHLQTGTALYTGMGSLQCHSDSKILLPLSFLSSQANVIRHTLKH